ncbi:MAG TPA: type VI secretion system baseplate subunit TssE [Burkholderiaceae bacterium]|nr:type VI secretion system baseplate subunit TssE [Burkholderiaceae bacterium]
MKGFAPSLIDKLLAADTASPSSGAVRRLSLEELKESVARDIESLLNSRATGDDARLKRFPHARDSIVSYGLNDFSGLSLASSYDRLFICRSIEQTIVRHEKRLTDVRVGLGHDANLTNRLHFTIHALLQVHPLSEPVNFDAMLTPTTQQYSVSRARRAASA